MAIVHLSSLHSQFFYLPPSLPSVLHQSRRKQASISAVDGANGAPAPTIPKRRGRPKSKSTLSSPSQKKTSRSRKKPEPENGKIADVEEDNEDFDDGMDFPYESPPLICCFGAAQREFIPTVRISDRQMDPDKYSTWKGLQWNSPEFVRAPGGPPSNVAISHVRLGGRAAFMGKVGDDEFGNELVYLMNSEKVQTRAVKIDPTVKTAISYLRIGFDGGKMRAETVKECAEDSMAREDVNMAVLKEVRR